MAKDNQINKNSLELNIEKGNKDQDKINGTKANKIKNSEINDNNTNINANENNSIYSAQEMTIYNETKAKQDSKYEFIEKAIDVLSNIDVEIYSIIDTYRKCKNCGDIFKEEYINMNTKLNNLYKIKEQYIVLPDDTSIYSKYIFGNPPVLYGAAGLVDAHFLQYEKNYIESYKNFLPGYFVPCQKHSGLQRTFKSLQDKKTRYEKLIENFK